MESDHAMMIVAYSKKIGNWGDCVKWDFEVVLEHITREQKKERRCLNIARILDTWEGREIRADWFGDG